MVRCVHSVVGNKIFLVQFEDGQKQNMNNCLLVFLSFKEEFEMYDPLSHSPAEKTRLIINYLWVY